ncbi:MAG: Nif11-like leader peptide family natural product precursor [Actinomycetota bacterium]|nr:Nif11-like leader peptide family natural product precursor [Actinomycetota bacterium]
MNIPENPVDRLTQQFGDGVRQFVERIETDESFRKEVRANPIEALKTAGLPEDLANSIAREPCLDFTCFSSECPGTCYVSIPCSIFGVTTLPETLPE